MNHLNQTKRMEKEKNIKYVQTLFDYSETETFYKFMVVYINY